MSYQALARKWRPRIFSEMVGQEHVVRALSNALDNDRLHHAYLFTGTRGVGKTTLARIFSKSLNCEHGIGSTPCGQCSICQEIDEGRFVDLLEVDAASRTKVEQTRELLENVPYAPVRGHYKVYLIDEVHMFSDSSFNALLKTLEEPPPHVKFLLATTDPQKVPVTVLSRCLQFNLKRLPLEQIQEHLQKLMEKEGVEYESAALLHLARAGDGSMRDALSLLDQAIAFGGGKVQELDVRAMLGVVAQGKVHELLQALTESDATRVMALSSMLADLAPDFSGVLQDLLSLLHRVALVQAVPDALDSSFGDEAEIQEIAQNLSPEDVQLFYQIGLIGQRDLPLAPDPKVGFEMVLLRMLAFKPAEMNATPIKTLNAVADKKKIAEAPDIPKVKSAPPEPQAEVKPKVAPVERSTPTDLSNWESVVEGLDLGGIARQLANNCIFDNWDGTNLLLRLDPTHLSMRVGSSEQRLAKALESYLGCRVKLEITVGEADQATPAQQQAKAEADRQREAEAAMASDPMSQALEERFGARLIPETVKPVS
ncbi:MAG: DNA polymerase III subunit gamma/tau [Gammaproteobacteria bacterium]|nr:DNA polymerase III subunit gamma/tau [Gammaproteobacteria bacterium]